MSASSVYLFQGRILWREVPNLVNDGEKRRPLIIISANRDIAAQQTVLCVACSHSTAMFEELPPHCVLVPEKIGKRTTKLPRPTAAVCSWIVEVEKASITQSDLAGSTGEQVLLAILKLAQFFVQEFLNRSQQTTDL